MKKYLRNAWLILLGLYSLFFVVGSTLPPLLAHYQYYDMSAQLTSLFIYSCHQQPDRSFWLFGYPMALCCRCYGVYIGTAVSCLLALLDRFKVNYSVFIIMLFISVVDIFINYGLGKRLNTGNITRFIVGILIGILIVSVCDYMFNWKGKRKYEN